MYQIFLIKMAFYSPDRVGLDFWGLVTRRSFNVKPQRTKETELFSQGTDDSKVLRCVTLCIADYEYENIFSFTVLLWRLTDRPSFIFIQIHSIVGSKLVQIVVIFEE